MERVVSLVQGAHRLMFDPLAATGLRGSKLLALAVHHLAFESGQPHVRVRQRSRWQKGQGQVIGPLKGRHPRRDLPIPIELAEQLTELVSGRDPGSLVFESPIGRSV
jgi:integrase